MRTVLVVEDEAMIRMIAAEMLVDAGFGVVEFCNAADAMEFCSEMKNEIAAVFTDIDMPGVLDGLDVAELMARKRPLSAIIVTSGRYTTRPADLAAYVQFFREPWAAKDLLKALEPSR